MVHFVQRPQQRPFMHPPVHNVFGEIIKHEDKKGKRGDDNSFWRCKSEWPNAPVYFQKQIENESRNHQLGEQQRRYKKCQRTIDQENFEVRPRWGREKYAAIKYISQRVPDCKFFGKQQPKKGNSQGIQ